MRTGRSSHTAEHNALFRALAAAEPSVEPPLDDPFAQSFLTWPLRLVVPLIRVPAGRRLLRSVIDRRWPGVRTSVVARTGLIDRTVAHAVDLGATQAVLLGAGFDSRAYRLPALDGLRIFEVDHPDTQRRKRATLEHHLGQIPDNVRFAATDFEGDDLDSVMAEAGFRAEEPSVFLWEGVSNYLGEPAVDRTLRWLGRAAPGSTVVFTYIDSDAFTNPSRYAGIERLHTTLSRVGEPLSFALDHREAHAYLRERGLVLESDLGAAEYRALHYGQAAEAMRGHEFYRVTTSIVAPPQ